MQATAARTGTDELEAHDLGPLAWVLDELRKSLDGATKALRRFVRDAELARGSDLAALDASQLRIARQQLHQAVGALEMVGMVVPAKVLRAMEALAQRFVERPELCSDDAANKLERASFALTEFLEGALKGKNASSVALFPQYKDVQTLVGDDRVHPADLWPYEWRWIDPALPQPRHGAASADASLVTRMDGCILKVVQSHDAKAAATLRDISLIFSAEQTAVESRVFWKVCAAYFEAVACRLCPPDVYAKRAASRILLQGRSLSRGEPGVSERLVRELLFFCAQAVPMSGTDAPVLVAIRSAYGLTQTKAFDYETPQFGRFDPALLVQARKRIAAATETWSALAGGDTNRLKLASEQFGLVGELVLRLHPESHALVRALTAAIESTVRSGDAPTPALAMEVATAVLYLEAAYDDMDPTDSHMSERSASLAARLEHVNAGGQPEPLEKWMEDLYRRVSDRQIMGSVVDELRKSIGEVEKSLDTFFRNPLDKVPLHEVPSQLAQMRGVFSVLGLDQAALAALRMRSSVEKFLVDDIDVESARAGIFLKLGNSLGAIGFLIDMLSYQRELAKKLFVYDEDLGEFKPVMGTDRSTLPTHVEDDDHTEADLAPMVATIIEPRTVKAIDVAPPVSAPPPEPMLQAASADADDDAELRDIFLEEAREVVQTGLAAIADLTTNPADLAQQTTLRRAFHTLKGSSRMVGFTEFGEAAWALEQLLNHWLAEQKPASADLLSLAQQSLHGLSHWVEDIASDAAAWSAQPFRQSADALRLSNQVVPLLLPQNVEQIPVAEALPEHPVESLQPEPPEALVTELADYSPAPAPELQAAFPSTSEPAEPASQGDSAPSREPQPAPPTLAPVAEPATTQTSDTTARVPADESVAVSAENDDQVKVIGSLRIGIPLYNVYLNEADEWSRRLLTELTEWALELDRPVHDSTVGLAHSLSGSSATVGFTGLSDIARGLEQALRHVRLHAHAEAEHAKLFVEAAEEIRRLLHQFAAGFLKEPDPDRLASLKAILAIEFPAAGPSVRDSLYEEEPEESQPVADSEFGSDRESAIAPQSEPPEHDTTPVAVGGDEVSAADIEVDSLEVVDAIDVDLFPIFEEEALELLPQLGGALRQWTARPENLGARKEVLRVLHTLKGSARLAGAMRLGEMTHEMESAIELLGTEFSQPPNLEPLLTRLDAIRANFEQLLATPEQARNLPEAAQVPEAVALPGAVEIAPLDAAPIIAPVVAPKPSTLPPLRHAPNQTVRVRAQLLDRMVNQAGEVMITRARLEARLGQLRTSLVELTGNLDRLRNLLRDIELQSESQMQSRLAQAKDSAQGFDPLEFDRFTRVQELTRMMAESVHDVATVQRNLQRAVEGTEDDLIAQARQARELQRDLLRTRMVEFDGVAERLHRAVRQAARDADKQVRLDIQGGSLDMDRGVLERMLPAFEHLLRNAVGHGIESPQARVAAGKPETGLIQIILQQHSDDVTVELRDDGAGLDMDQLRARAIADGHMEADASLTDAELVKLIYTSGFTTAQVVTELSGRGVGLDIVRSEVHALGGRIETSTQRGLGTSFKLVLPLTTAVTQVVMLRVGELVIGVPANLVEIVRRVPLAELEHAYEVNAFEYDHEMVPFFWVGALLQASAHSSETRSKTIPVAVFRSAGQRLAAHIDEVLGNQEVVVKNLGPQLSRLPGLVGMSVLASGAVVLIYNPVALTAVYGAQATEFRRASERRAAPPPALTGQPKSSLVASVSQTPLILVVDDSITVRRVTQRLLKREGFRVSLANDGLQALERLQEERPAVVLSDIEMPRMDGFDLARNIRADAKLADLPIIMITSRIAEKHRDHARELGVNHYLGKPYSEDVLIGLIRQHCAAPLQTTQ